MTKEMNLSMLFYIEENYGDYKKRKQNIRTCLIDFLRKTSNVKNQHIGIMKKKMNMD